MFKFSLDHLSDQVGLSSVPAVCTARSVPTEIALFALAVMHVN
jgi:hypothetical protein